MATTYPAKQRKKQHELEDATTINGVTHTYDNNGNLTQAGSWNHTWNYRNNLTQSGNGTATTTYAYDHAGERVLKTEGGVTTAFPNKLYNTSSTTTTKHIFANGIPIATITSGAAASGIALDATSTIIHGGYTSGPTTKNWTHTTSGSNRLLVLVADIWQDVGGTGTITSATYNGTSLTKAISTRAGGMASEIWYLVNPASGSNTVSVTVTSPRSLALLRQRRKTKTSRKRRSFTTQSPVYTCRWGAYGVRC